MWLSSLNVDIVVLPAGAYELTKYLWIGGALFIGRADSVFANHHDFSASQQVIPESLQTLWLCIYHDDPYRLTSDRLFSNGRGRVGSCKHTVSTCRAQCDMKSRCWYATADWLPRDGERNTKALCIDVRLCSTRPWLNPMSRYLTKMRAWAAVSMRGSTGLGCAQSLPALRSETQRG